MFDLEKLTEFTRALVSYFETEASTYKYPRGSMHQVMHMGLQYIDIYNAYLYAQDTILPWIKTHGIAAITPELLEKELHQVHALMADTLGKDSGFQAGHYTPASDDVEKQVYRWHPTMDAVPAIARTLGTTLVGVEREQLIEENSAFIEKHFYVKAHEMAAFFELAKQYQGEPEPDPKNDQDAMLDRAERVVQRLCMASLEDKLSSDQAAVLGKVVTFVDSRKAPERMKVFLHETIEAWKTCDPNNREALSRLLAKTFYRFTDIHPYPNGNGRMGTLLLNIMLRSMGQPAILLREPGDKANPESTYARAVDNLKTGDWELLTEHILSRLEIANTAKNESQKNEEVVYQYVTLLRMNLAYNLLGLRTSFPEFKLEAYFEKIKSKAHEKSGAQIEEGDSDQVIDLLESLYTGLVEKQGELLLEKIKQTFAKVTGYAHWDGAPDGEGVKCWRVMESQSDAEALMKDLSQYASFTVEKKDLVFADETVPILIVQSSISGIRQVGENIQLREEGERQAQTLGPVFKL